MPALLAIGPSYYLEYARIVFRQLLGQHPQNSFAESCLIKLGFPQALAHGPGQVPDHISQDCPPEMEFLGLGASV